MRGIFVKILLWFWVSLVLVGLAVHVAIITTEMPIEVSLSPLESEQGVQVIAPFGLSS